MGHAAKRIWSWIWRLLLGALIVLLLLPATVPPFLDRIYYRGPVSGHFDGQHFFNPDGEQGTGGMQKRSIGSIWLRLHRLDAVSPWPAHVATPAGRPATVTDPKRMVVTWIGHSTVQIGRAHV